MDFIIMFSDGVSHSEAEEIVKNFGFQFKQHIGRFLIAEISSNEADEAVARIMRHSKVRAVQRDSEARADI